MLTVRSPVYPDCRTYQETVPRYLPTSRRAPGTFGFVIDLAGVFRHWLDITARPNPFGDATEGEPRSASRRRDHG